MKIKIILSLFILIVLIRWALQGCKKSAVEPEDSEGPEISLRTDSVIKHAHPCR